MKIQLFKYLVLKSLTESQQVTTCEGVPSVFIFLSLRGLQGSETLQTSKKRGLVITRCLFPTGVGNKHSVNGYGT